MKNPLNSHTLIEQILITAEAIIAIATQKNITISTAESCTGGMISQYLTAISGASQVFFGGICVYTDCIKHKLLHISSEDLQQYSAVSKQIALQMAENAKILFQTDYAISTTGYAGPSGGDEKNPLGTVYIAIATPSGSHCEKLYYPNHSRDEIRLLATLYALEQLKSAIIQNTIDSY